MKNKRDTLEKLLTYKVVAIIRSKSTGLAEVADAIITGGIYAVEISLNSPGALSEINQLSKIYRNHPDVVIGAGTVTGIKNAGAAIEAGASFIISPVLEEEVIEICNQKEVVAIPGVVTPTEMYRAVQSGADMVKLFPASVFGPEYIKAVKAPMPYVKVMAVGGINQKNTIDYLQAGCDAVGIGSALIKDEDIIGKRYDAIASKVLAYREFIS